MLTFRPKIRILIDLFLLFAHDNSTKIYGPLSFILSLCTTIRPKIRVLIDSFLLYVHDHSTKVRGHSYSLIYYFLNCVNISFAIFMAFIFLLLFFWQSCLYISYAIIIAVLPLYFVHYIHGSATLIFCMLYSCLYEIFAPCVLVAILQNFLHQVSTSCYIRFYHIM